MKGNYYWRDPCLTCMMMGGRRLAVCPLNIYHPERKFYLRTIHFQGRAASFRGRYPPGNHRFQNTLPKINISPETTCLLGRPIFHHCTTEGHWKGNTRIHPCLYRTIAKNGINIMPKLRQILNKYQNAESLDSYHPWLKAQRKWLIF